MRRLPSLLLALSSFACLLALSACTATVSPAPHQGGDGNGGPGGPSAGGTSSSDGGVKPPTAPPTIPTGTARVRVLHASAGIGNVDLCFVTPTNVIGPVFGTLGVAAGVGLGDNPGYFELPSGTYQVHAVGAGLPCAQTPLVPSTSLTLPDAAASTLLVLGNLQVSLGKRGAQFALLTDDLVKPGVGRKVRFLHAAPEFPGALDLKWRVSGASTWEVALEGASYGGAATASQVGTITGSYVHVAFGPGTSGLEFATEGMSQRVNAFRTLWNFVGFPAGTSNFTVIAFGANEPPGTATIRSSSFLACADEDKLAKDGGIGRCEMGREP